MGKKRIRYLLAVLLLATTTVYSQEVDEQEPMEKIRVHLAPLNFFDPVTAVLQMGVQKRITDRWSVSLDHGFRSQAVSRLIERETERKDHRYSKTKAELKYFFRPNSPAGWSRVFPYLSLEGMYFPQEYYKEKDWLHREEASYLYASSHIKRPVWVASLKFGKETRYRKVVVDKFIGIGLRYMSIKHQQTVGAVESIYDEPIDIHFPPIDRQEGTFWRPHLSLGVKFGLPFE